MSISVIFGLGKWKIEFREWDPNLRAQRRVVRKLQMNAYSRADAERIEAQLKNQVRAGLRKASRARMAE